MREHEQEVAASEAANALQSAELKAQQKAVEDKQRELDELQASLWAKVCAAGAPNETLIFRTPFVSSFTWLAHPHTCLGSRTQTLLNTQHAVVFLSYLSRLTVHMGSTYES